MYFIFALLLHLLVHVTQSQLSEFSCLEDENLFLKKKDANVFLKYSKRHVNVNDDFDGDDASSQELDSPDIQLTDRKKDFIDNLETYVQVKNVISTVLKTMKLLELRNLQRYPGAYYGFPRLVLKSSEGVKFESPFKNGLGKFMKTYKSKYLYGDGFSDDKFKEMVEDLYEENMDGLLKSETTTILYRYAACVRKYNTNENCPNPCNRIPCTKKSNAYAVSCVPKQLFDARSFNISMHQDYPEDFKKIFYQTYECSCEHGYKWAQARLKCEPYDICRVYDRNPCLNGGTCVYTPTDRKRSFKCACLPSYTGDRCQSTFNPCRIKEKTCNGSRCERDPSIPAGYRCICEHGLRSIPNSPLCYLHFNPCESSPCINGGECRNSTLPGQYNCSCINDYFGLNCQYKNEGQWGPWIHKYSECSATCDRGHIILFRSCSKENACRGTATRSIDCHAYRPCPIKKLYDDIQIIGVNDQYSAATITANPQRTRKPIIFKYKNKGTKQPRFTVLAFTLAFLLTTLC